MTKKVSNTHVKDFMKNVERFHDNVEIKNIIKECKMFGVENHSNAGMNSLFMFAVLKEADEITNKEVKRIIENFRAGLQYKEVISNADSRTEKQYINSNKLTDEGTYNMELLKAFDSRFNVFDERTYRRYGNAIRKASEMIQELLGTMPVQEPVQELTRTQKQSIERWFDAGMSEEALLEYIRTRKS